MTTLHISCLCVGYFSPALPAVQFGSANYSSEVPIFAESSEPIQSYVVL